MKYEKFGWNGNHTSVFGMDMDAEDGRKKVENARRHDAIRAMDAEEHLVKKVENARRLDAAAAIRAFDAKEERIKKVEDARRVDAAAAILAMEAKEGRIKKVEDTRRVDAADAILAMEAEEGRVKKVEDARRVDAILAAADTCVVATGQLPDPPSIIQVPPTPPFRSGQRPRESPLYVPLTDDDEDEEDGDEETPTSFTSAKSDGQPWKGGHMISATDSSTKNIIVRTRQVQETVQQPRKRKHAGTTLTPINLLTGQHYGQITFQELWIRQTRVYSTRGINLNTRR